jgi:hypothetical protein
MSEYTPEDIIDFIVDEVKACAQTLFDDGGFADVLDLKTVYFGDPGVIPARLYPACTVDLRSDEGAGESTGTDKHSFPIAVSLHIDAREYFEKDSDEATGDRALVRATFALSRWFKRRDKRTLDGRVLDIDVTDSQFTPDARGNVIVKTSQTILVVKKNYMKVH